MENLLNRGLNFVVLPEKLNLTQVLVDFRKFERTMLWTEFWSGQPQENHKPPIFKTHKTNLPKKHPTPKTLKNMLAATKSEILDPENRNQARPNLPPGEMKALARLIELQKYQVITIKPCDKGGGIIILYFSDYISACEKHLNAKQEQSDGPQNPYYQEVEEKALDEIRQKVNEIVDEAFDNGIIKKEEYEAMKPDEKTAARFYCTFKVHKEHEVGKAPPVRPIISGNGSVTENISAFVDHHIKLLAIQHFSFL